MYFMTRGTNLLFQWEAILFLASIFTIHFLLHDIQQIKNWSHLHSEIQALNDFRKVVLYVLTLGHHVKVRPTPQTNIFSGYTIECL